MEKSKNNKADRLILGFFAQFMGQLLGILLLLFPGLLLFWLLPVWLVPIVLPLMGLVWAIIWLGKTKLMEKAHGLQILAFIVLAVLVLMGVVPDLHDLLGVWEEKVIHIQYEEEALEQKPLSLLYFEDWEVELAQLTTYRRKSRRVQGDNSPQRIIHTSIVPLKRKRKALEDVYVIAVDGNVPHEMSAINFWKKEGMRYGFVPNKMHRLSDYQKAVEKMKGKGVGVHPEAIFVELYDSADGRKEYLLKWLKVKVGVGGLIWFLIHLGTFLFVIYKKSRSSRPSPE